MPSIVFDIETGPLPEDQLAAMIPPFDPAEVKVGNLKDPLKIAEKIEAARAEHETSYRERAALSPLTGQVLAIGYGQAGNGLETKAYHLEFCGELNECQLLLRFWTLYRDQSCHSGRLIGHNIFRFDLPFLVRRSWLHDVVVPESVLVNGRYWSDVFVDTMAAWSFGDHGPNGYVSLDTLARFFSVGQKTPGVSGADFARLFAGPPEDRQAALEYLANDLELTWKVAERMGLV